MASDLDDEELQYADDGERKKVIRINKPAYADFKETRNGHRQLTCDCGSQSWHLWEDKVASCANCGLPEPEISFCILEPEDAEKALGRLMQ